jgi:hypothetical protein
MIAPLFFFLAAVSISVLIILASLPKPESGPLKSRHGILVIFLGLALAFSGTTIRSSLALALSLIIGGLAVAAAGFVFAVYKLARRG